MHSDLIDATRDEVLRLLGKQDELLTDLLKVPDLIREDSHVQEHGTTRRTIDNWQSILSNEAKKVGQLEMVLTVLGTMKAGKSTTINAIVGYEVLPNRNYPMTTLPTLIRHKEGQKEPILHFPKRVPIEEMVDLVRERVIALKREGQLDSVGLYAQEDGQELIDKILTFEFGNFKETYIGQEEIFLFLKSLNDLMRLSQDKNIDVNPPLDEYKSIIDFPSIEVEFFHLAQSAKLTKGSLALLDTPGPNEELLGHKLRKVLTAQLERASAILAILDYTQLGGEAEGEVRREISRQANSLEDRSFFIVNKFDQKNKRGMKADEVKRRVADVVMGGKVSKERVYPVSALYGYLSNRALRELATHKGLPEDENDGWVADFGQLAMGASWDPEDISLDEVKVAAERVWKSSRFDLPITEVIVKAANTAALASMQSAAAKMIENGNRLENFLEIQRGGLTKTVSELRHLIEGLAKDIAEVEKAEGQAENELNGLIDNSLEIVQLQYQTTKEKLRLALEGYFQEGKKLEADQLLERTKTIKEKYNLKLNQMSTQRNRRFSDPFANFHFFGAEGKDDREVQHLEEMLDYQAKESLDFDPKNPKINFETEHVAKFFLRQINEKISSIFSESSQEFELALKDLSKGLEETIPQIIVEGVGEILKNAQERLKDEGFSISFDVPEPRFESGEIEITELLLSSVEDSTRTTAIRRRRQKSGWLNTAKRWFGDKFDAYDWGYEDYVDHQTERIYVVDMTKIQERVLDGLDDSAEKLSDSSKLFFDTVLRPLVDKYFEELTNYLEDFRSNLSDGIDKHKLDEQAQEMLMQSILALKERTELHTQDVLAVKNNLT